MEWEEELDLIDAIELDDTLSRSDKADRFSEALQDAAPGSEFRLLLLGARAEHLQAAERFAEARAAIAELAAESPRGQVEADVTLLDLELQLGNTDAADAVLARLLGHARAQRLDYYDYSMVGESLEIHDREREAMRWFTMPIRDVRPDDLDEQHFLYVNARYRVRRALGLPLDVYDEVAEEFEELEGSEPGF